MSTGGARSPVKAGGVRSVVIVGSGIAGLYTVLLTAAQLPDTRITLISKGSLEQSNTWHAQGGIAAVLAPGLRSDGDSPGAHSLDTQAAGAGFVDQQAADILCAEAVRHIEELQSRGARFDPDLEDPQGVHRLALTREAAHSAARILHAGGDATGKAIVSALIAAVRALPGVCVLEDTFLSDFTLAGGAVGVGAVGVGASAGGVVGSGAVVGVRVLRDGREEFLPADAVVLATGGAGQLYAHNTNPTVATGDGLAAAWRAGAVLADLEFFQFHPTSLDVPGNPLISEAVRGEGAILLDDAGNRFMPQYHSDAELAPRDVVSRSITLHLQKTGGSRVFLDARGVGGRPGYLGQRFPSLDALTRSHGFNWEREPIPVVPAAHYWMGGVRTDLDGHTSIPGLYAAGEVACTGVHGANRLASNSLLEGLVFAGRAVAALSARLGAGPGPGPGQWPSFPAGRLELEMHELNGSGPDTEQKPDAVQKRDAAQKPDAVQRPDGEVFKALEEPDRERFSRRDLQQLMAESAGVLRNAPGLETAAKQLAVWNASLSAAPASYATSYATSSVAPALFATGRAPATSAMVAAPSPDIASVSVREDANLLLTARLLVAAAHERRESRGAHFRTDFPQPASGARSRSYVRSPA